MTERMMTSRQGYAMEDFQLSVTQPLALLVRAQGIWIHLYRLFPFALSLGAPALTPASDFYATKSLVADVPAVKDAFKWIAGFLLPALLHVRRRD